MSLLATVIFDMGVTKMYFKRHAIKSLFISRTLQNGSKMGSKSFVGICVFTAVHCMFKGIVLI